MTERLVRLIVSGLVAAVIVAGFPVAAVAGTTVSSQDVYVSYTGSSPVRIVDVSLGRPVTVNGFTDRVKVAAVEWTTASGDYRILVHHSSLPTATGHGAYVNPAGSALNAYVRPAVVGSKVFYLRRDASPPGTLKQVWCYDLATDTDTMVWSQEGLTSVYDLRADGDFVTFLGQQWGADFTLHRLSTVGPSTWETVTTYVSQPTQSFFQSRGVLLWSIAPAGFGPGGTDPFNIYRKEPGAGAVTETITSYSGGGGSNGAAYVTGDRDWVSWTPLPLAGLGTQSQIKDLWTGTTDMAAPGTSFSWGTWISGARGYFVYNDTISAPEAVGRQDLYTGEVVEVTGTAGAPWYPMGLGRAVLWADSVPSSSGTYGYMRLSSRDVTADRVTGADRYEVAANAARMSYPGGFGGVNTVVIACGLDRASADPLAAGGLCWKYDAPLLLTDYARLPTYTRTVLNEIKAANPAGSVKVIVVGGPASVPEARMRDLRTIFGATKVERLISTGTRYDLAAKIAYRMKYGPGGLPLASPATVLVANGADQPKFMEALAMSAVSRAKGYPLLLVKKTAAPAATVNSIKNVIKPTRVAVAGNTGDVNAAVYTAVGGTHRWEGADVQQTVRMIAEWSVRNRLLLPRYVGVAAKLPDALTGGAAVGRYAGPILATNVGSLSTAASTWLDDWGTDADAFTVFGGPVSVTPAQVTTIDQKLAQ